MKKEAGLIDITGNWHDEEGFKPFIQTREPWIKDEETRLFYQTLSLEEGQYCLLFEYDQFLDKKDGFSLNCNYNSFEGLKINDTAYRLKFIQDADNRHIYTAVCDFTISDNEHLCRLELEISNTRVMRTWIKLIGSELPVSTQYHAVSPGMGGEYLLVHGIPFLIGKVDIRHFTPYIPGPVSNEANLLQSSSGNVFACHGAEVSTAYFLGMIHNIDIANGSWYSKKGDHGYSHFAGDKAGEIKINWTNGEKLHIPLVFGFNLWYSRPWDIVWNYEDNPYEPGSEGRNFDSVMFCGKDGNRDILQDNISLVDGVRLMGAYSCNARFIFSVDFQGRGVHSIEIDGVAGIYGYPLISAITLETAKQLDELEPVPSIYRENPNIKPISLEYIENEFYSGSLEKIKRLLYTHVEYLPVLKTPKIPDGYFGPEYDFCGTPEAVYAATYLYHNGPECAAYIADSGTCCCSSTAKWALHHYTLGMGVWIERKPLYDGLKEWFRLYKEREPGGLPGKNEMWTRGAGQLIREATAFGYDRFVDPYIDWLDHALMTEANPPHWNRIAGHPEFAFNSVQVGETEERGNRENDGHGNCMWARYMAWHWHGRSREWNERHWAATSASVEWIRWQLDNDVIRPGVRIDVLYTESECAHGAYDIYSTYSCLHGLKLAIRMAESLGKKNKAQSWRVLYERLRSGILMHLTEESEYGTIWHTEQDCDWQDHAHKLVHLQLAPDGDTYTPLQDYSTGDDIDKRFMKIDRNTYCFLMKERNYNCLRMYGYGQGMMAQSALLLDEMKDAENFASLLLKHCYLPEFGGWISPEGIILHKSGKYYLPVNGYMGQDSHVADSTKAIRLMLGIDDNDPEHLRFVPRYPMGWDKMHLGKYPVTTGHIRQFVSYRYLRENDRHTFSFELDLPVGNISIRLGPLPLDLKAVSARLNNREVPCEVLCSGDSSWVWVGNISGKSGIVDLVL